MTYLGKGMKIDLMLLAQELGESPDSGMRIVDLKDLILKSSAYDEELVKNMLTNIIEERKAKELKKQRSEELDEERRFELEKLRMQTTHNEFLKTTESVASGTDVPQIEFKKLIPNFNPKETDIATFLNLFERQLKFLKVPNTHWVAYLLGVLPGDVAKLIAREPEEQSHDYDHIKKMLLSRFKLSGDSFRQLFYRHQKSSENTWKDYYFELQNFFESWLQDLRIASFDKLKDLIIAEQMKKRTSPEMRDHFWEEWFAWVTPSQLAAKLDTYDNLRKIKDISLNNKRNAYEKTKEISRSFSGPRESFSKITEKPRGETRKKDRSSIYCYGCGAQGFIKARCPTCNLTETVPKLNMNSMSFYSSLVESQPVSLIEVFICHHQAAVCADTGATHSVAGEKLYRLLKDNGVKFIPNITGIKLGDGEEKIVDILTATVDIHVKGKKVPTSLMVLTNARGNRTLLGTDFLKAAGIVLDIPMGKWYFSESPRIKFDFIRNPPNIAALLAVSENVSPCHLRKDEGTHLTVHQTGQLNSLLEKFETCFQPGGEATPFCEHHIDTGNTPPISVPPYRMNPAKKEILRTEIDRLLAEGIREECESPYASPVVLVPKPDGGIRLCVDYRKLNARTKADSYPLPRLDDLMHEARHTPFMSTIDLRAGYHQVKVHPADQDKTAFTCPFGTYRYLRMPFGLRNAPSTFQRLIDRFRGGLGHVLVLSYLDDIIVLSDTFEKHITDLQSVFERLTLFKLHANRHKCHFAGSRVKYLGFWITQEGLEIDRDKVSSVQKIPPPTNVKEVQSFLQTCSWFRRYIPNFAERSRPLSNITKKKVPWGWGFSQQKAFELLKECLITPPVLKQADGSNPYIIRTDASSFALGAVLLQGQGAGERPIEYASRLLSPAEINYSTTEREALAVVWALKKFRGYVESSEITIESDHQPLKWLLSLKSPTGRLARWALEVQSFNLKVQYVPGKANVIADMLSRPVVPNVPSCEVTNIIVADMPARSPKTIRESQLQDKNLEKIIRDEKKKAYLLTLMGSKTYGVLKNLCSPILPKDKTFDNLIDILKRHFSPKRSIVVERFIFFKRMQLKEESISDYLVEIKRLASSCNFGNFLEDSLRHKMGYLCEVASSKWATPVVVVPKKNKEIRICCDFKVTLNKYLDTAAYPLPTQQDLFSTLAKKKYFSKLDLRNAYLQLEMDPDTRPLLTINTHKGLFRFKRMPFGLANAPSYFQSVMDRVLSGIGGVICYIDDVLIATASIEEHLALLKTIFARLAKPLDHKVQAIQKAKTPTNISELRSFLGLVNFYGKFIPNLPELLKPLHELLHKKRPWVWTKECGEAIDKCKNSITSERVLVPYNATLPLCLATDASQIGVGAVLSHIIEGQERPIMFASRTLSEAEQNYSQIEKEALAIIYGVTKLHQFIYGRKFILIIDHKPLVTILGSRSGIPTLSTSRLQRWALILSAYTYDIKFRRTQDHGNADLLSRFPAVARSHFWWPNLDTQIEFLVNKCRSCQQSQDEPNKGKWQPWRWSTRPWQRIHIDFANKENINLLIVVDSHSKWIEAIPMRETTTRKTIEQLRRLFSSYGLPEELVSDNGPQFTGSQMKGFLEGNGIKQTLIPAYHPQNTLSKVLLAYRSTPHVTTGKTPSELFIGRALRTRVSLIHPSLASRVWDQQARQMKFDRRTQLEEFQIDDLVWCKNFRGGDKWIPGKIVGKKGTRVYTILIHGQVKAYHRDQIRKRKCDLSKLAYELGEVVPPESRIVDLKRLILNSQSYEEEFAKQLLETLIEEREQTERAERERMEQTAQTEQAERIERERKEQIVMEFELEKLRIQTTRGNNDTSRSTSNDAHYEIRKLMPKYESKDNDLSFYLILFERQAKRLGLDEDQWAFSLLGLLPYEMTQLIARETEEQSGDYRFVKRLLLKRYKLSPEQFRQKFEKHERSQKGSWRDFAFELRGYFNEWIEGMNVENFDALKDLSVTNQLKKKVPNVLRNHLIDDWTKLNNPDELADKLDEYENVRTEMGPPHWNAKHLIPPSFQQKSARFPNQSEVKETKQGTNVSGQDAARNEISETYPNTLRRMVNRAIRNDKGEPKCFNCNQFGHIARDCPAPRTTLTCRGCGQTGHKERNCTRPKEGLKVANLEVEGLETVPPDVYLKDVKIDNKETVKAMIDTGSSSCLMRESVARRISVDIEPDSTSLYGIGNQTAPAARTVGKTTVDLEIDGVVGKEIAVFIVNDDAQPYDLLIGRTWTDLPYVSFARIGKELHIGYSTEFPFANLQEEIKSRRVELRATETVQLESDSINFTSAITDEVKDGYVLFTGVDDACVDSLLEVVDGKTTVPIISAGKGKLRVRKNQCVGRVELLNLDDIVVNLDVAEDSFQTKNEEKREGQDQMKRKPPILPEDINVNHSLTSKERQEILDVVNEYRDCFALGMEELGCTDVTKMDIKEVDGSKPVCLRPYKTTASEREAIREIVREWKDNGIVTETRSPYASPVLLVRKKTGDHRLVVDYRRLNIQTVKDKFPLPRIDDLLEGLRNAKFFTTLDLAHGYLQIPLTDKAKLKTAFITPDDTGQFERMIFGLANAPAEFQRLMHTVLGPLLNKKAFCYLDDVIIPAKDWREMIERLREVLERIRSAKLTLKPSKCEFGRREVEFLGYVISTGGLKPGPRKIKAIEEFPEPKNVHDIRRFLGLTNFFRRFVKDFARKAEPLSRLTKKGSQFEWKEEQRRSFGGLRKDLVEYPVLAHYNPELKTEVHCDASAEGLAGMVLQMDEDGKWRLVYCVSKKTTEAEKMYHSSKLELMAIVWTLDRLRQFLVGIKFTVVTDCQALVYMNAKKTTNPQIARWYNLIQEYDFEIRHKPGEKMAHVDGMSRAPVDDPRDTMEEIVEKNLEVCLTITPEEQILMIQHSDPELRDLIQIFRKDPCDRTVGEQNRINDYSYRRKSGRGARSRRYPPTQPTTFLQRKVQSRTIEIQEWPNVGAIPTREPQINRL
ncbi:hypothetical protein LAZ67_2003535 [Cordylochernes scorpioides]|uniref:RNA-directed DNA polymerase n=1 Tax=Cordylochernes scorpioides TaxID=51811 RepID=A0ABY6K688_9ARAC|nr:hypothetical protein LAZ67_2003535 [Cordylochernes scorpioides]